MTELEQNIALRNLLDRVIAENELEVNIDKEIIEPIDWNEHVKPEGKIQIEGEEFITLAELRRLARARGYIYSKPKVVQTPEWVNNRQATVEWEIMWSDGIVDGACADASWKTCNPGFSNYTVAIASNRAEARCIRAALGINTCSLEELGPKNEEDVSGPASDQQKSVIEMLVKRKKLDAAKFAEIVGEELAAQFTDGSAIKLDKMTHHEGVSIVGKLNAYKGE